METSPKPDDKAKPKNDPKNKPAAKPPVKVFARFKPEIDLLTVADPAKASGGTQLVNLGEINVDDNATMFVVLEGGEHAYKKGVVYSCRNANGGTALREWEFVMAGGVAGSSDELRIAQMKLEDKKLKFGWTPEAAVTPTATYLSNCALTMSAGPDTHTVRLRMPTKGTPLEIDLKKPVVSTKVTVPSPPNPDGCQIEILAFENGPKVLFEGTKVIPADGGSTWMNLGTEPAKQFISIRLQTTMSKKGQVEIKAMAHMLMPGAQAGQTQRVTYSSKKVDSEKARIAQENQYIAQGLMNAEKALKDKKIKEDRNKSALIAQQKNLAELRQAANNQLLEKLTAFDAIRQQFEAGPGKLHFRVFFAADSGQVDLLTTK